MMIRALCIFLISVPFAVSANIFPVLDDPLELELIPAVPKPGEVVRIHARLFTENPSGATYVWRVNGQVVDQGVGRTAITRTAGGLGSTTIVELSVSMNGAVIAEESVAIRPAGVDILWEADTARIPLIPHLPRPNGDSRITAVAVPHIVRASGARIAASDLVYTWRVNRSSTPARSGYGLQTLTLRAPQFENPFSITVAVSTREGDIRAEETIVIRPERPSVLFYEQAPLLGLRLDRAIRDSFVMQGEEVTVGAFPLSMNDDGFSLYRWSANRTDVAPSEDDPRTITFRRTGEGRGFFTIEFSAEGFQTLFERARASFLLTF